jgi:murein hydrolase activator
VPKPRPGAAAPSAPAPAMNNAPIVKDLSGAVPVDQATHLPSTAEQYRKVKNDIAKTKPDVESAKKKSETLTGQANRLRQKLIDSASRVQALEEERGRLDADIARLSAQEARLGASFARDRVQVARLLAILERLQLDMPPTLALKPADAVGAARGAMMLGASLPRIYGAAAELAHRLDVLRATRITLTQRRAQAAANSQQLGAARIELDQLLAMKQQEASEASEEYGTLQSKLDTIAGEAADLGQLLAKVAALRAQPAGQSVTVVTAQNAGTDTDLKRGSLLRPVIGRIVPGGFEGAGGTPAPGLTFLAESRAQVVAPADSRVLFAGSYHKTGQVLILEMAGGYDLVLAGLDRVDVRSGDQLLAGEPLGTMPLAETGARLYFEVRYEGKGVSPAPWLEVELRKAKRS